MPNVCVLFCACDSRVNDLVSYSPAPRPPRFTFTGFDWSKGKPPSRWIAASPPYMYVEREVAFCIPGCPS